MEILIQAILALLLLTVAVYAQRQIPVYTRGRARIMVARAILALVGIAFGLTAITYVHGYIPKLLTFLIGFGTVHVPAAIVLFIKGQRGEGKS